MKPDDIPAGMKWCPHCEQVHPFRAFSKDSRNKSGLQSWCIKCIHEHPSHKSSAHKRVQKSYKKGWIPPWAKT